jgi:hypothetical protein
MLTKGTGVVFTLIMMAAMAGGARAQVTGQDFPDVDRLPVIKEFPDPFLMANGKRVAAKRDWEKRRKEIRAILQHYEYGSLPPPPGNLKAVELSSTSVFDGKAVERRFLLSFGPRKDVKFSILLTIPLDRPGPFPALLTGDLCWGRAPIPEEIVKRGYLLAEFDRTELAPDRNNSRTEGVYPLYPGEDWGALAVWAWGYHRAVDFLRTLDYVDARRIAITGHSRGGKTALLAGALDERIALVNPNDSGCGGAGSYRFHGKGSETLAAILKNFPYWFSPRLKQFIGHEDQLPFDQHFLMALVAPRALLITNALDDLWANPEGTQQTYLAAKQVYAFLGAGDRIGNHYREGGHAHNAADWRTLLDFADRQFFRKPVTTTFEGRLFPDSPRAFSWTAPPTKR